jgi:hypothetical protein
MSIFAKLPASARPGRIAAFWTIAALIPAVAAQPLPAVMKSGSWLEIPDTQMRAVASDMDKFPKVRAVLGPAAVIIAWGGAALDTRRNQLILWGGGHADYYGNELYAFDIAKLAWGRLTDPFPEPVLDQEINADGTPNSRHTYNGLAYLAHADRFFGQGGSLAGSGFAPCGLTWTFDLEKKRWENRQPAGKSPGGGFGQSCAYDPASQRLYFGNERGLSAYDHAENEWQLLNDAPFYYQTMAVDPKRGQLLAVGDGALHAYDLKSGDFRRRELKTSGGDAFIKRGNPGFDYDPAADQMVGWSDGTLAVLDLATNIWKLSEEAAGPKKSVNGTYGRWRFVPAVNAFILVTAWDENVWFYKHSAGDRAPGAAE